MDYTSLASLMTGSNDSLEQMMAGVHYDISEQDVQNDDESPNRERFVRLMSVDAMQFKKVGGPSYSISNESSEDYDVCIEFCDIVTFAETFIDDILNEAENIKNKDTDKTAIDIRRLPSEHRIFLPRFSDADSYPVIEYGRPQFSGWLTIKEFTVVKGGDKIDEYLSSFPTSEEWLYIIYFLGSYSDNLSKFYRYEAAWSLPTPEYPIPQATASIFFIIEVSQVLPPECLVTVTFMFESYRFKHTPGITDFCEEWLNYILDAKIEAFKKIKY